MATSFPRAYRNVRSRCTRDKDLPGVVVPGWALTGRHWGRRIAGLGRRKQTCQSITWFWVSNRPGAALRGCGGANGLTGHADSRRGNGERGRTHLQRHSLASLHRPPCNSRLTVSSFISGRGSKSISVAAKQAIDSLLASDGHPKVRLLICLLGAQQGKGGTTPTAVGEPPRPMPACAPARATLVTHADYAPMPSNREWVLLGMVPVALAGGLLWPGTRPAVRQLPGILRILLSRQLLVPLLFTMAWTAGIVWLGWWLSIWDVTLTTTSVLWFLTAGSVLFGKAASQDALKEPHFFRHSAVVPLGISALLGAYVTLTVLPLWAELLLQPILVVAAALYAVARTQNKYAGCASALTALFIGVGLGDFIYVTVSLATDWSTTNWRSVSMGVLLPVWLTIGLLPCVYLLALYSACQSIVTRAGIDAGPGLRLTPRRRFRAWVALATGFGLRPRAISTFTGPWPRRLGTTGSLGQARAVIRRFRDEVRGDPSGF
jgi:hypothetical protein